MKKMNKMLIKFKWIFFILCTHLLNVVVSQNFVFPDSDENSDRFSNMRQNWQIKAPLSTINDGVKTVKKFFTSSRSSLPQEESVQEPMAMQRQIFHTGSGSSAQANSGSMSFGYPGQLSYGGGSGSQSSAMSGSGSYGGGMYGSGSQSSAMSGSGSYGGSPMYGGSSSNAMSGSSSFGGNPLYGGGSMSGSQSNAMSGSGNMGAGGGGSGSFASSGSMSMSGSSIPCTTKPTLPANAGMSCKRGIACQISCLTDFTFPNGESTLTVECNNGRWLVKSFEFNEIPPCEPVCLPKCLNSGICIAPGQCKCPDNFMGPSCQFEKKLCLTSPPLPANSKRSCSQSLCTVTCMKGYKFPDASLSMNLLCKDGNWAPEKQGIKLIPDCEPICEPKCQNGGNCLAYNVCQCPPNYRGPQCQYSIERCLPKKLNFNGAYNCSSTGDLISCKLYCPKGISFDFEPASPYTCNYAVGEFQPKQVPKCVYGEGMEVIQMQPSGSVQYGQTNGTWVKKSSGKKNTVVQEVDDGEDEDEEEIEETVITTKKKITKKKKKTKKIITEDEDEEFFQVPGVYQFYIGQELEVTHRAPKPSVCITWNGNKIKTFDGVTYSHELICSHVLVQDFIDGTFNVILRSCPYESVQPCPHALEVFLQNEQFTFENVGGGQVKMFTTKKEIQIPVQIAGLKVTRSGMDVRILLEAIPLTITWDTKKFVQIDASASVFNRTAGICGTMDGIMSNDFMSKDGEFHKMPATFVDSWRALNMDKSKEKCTPRSGKMATKCETSVEEKANLVCTDLLANPKMNNCLKMFNTDVLMKNCISDYCDCKNTYDRTECICNGMAVLAKDCRFRGVLLDDGWRDWQICPLNCTNGRVYKSCGPLNEPSCGSAIESDSFNCREGCFCPDGTMLNDGICVKKEMCPCRLKGKAFAPSSKIKRDCNTCVCENGNWECTAQTCGSRCSSIGDPHYTTFDGKRFDFMGKCAYYLMKTEDVIVEAENVACSGAISESMNFLPSFTTELPSCTKSLTIKFNDNDGQQRIIKLKQGGFVLLDGFEVNKLPRELSDGAVVIRQASSSFILVDFHDGAKVWWDGSTRAYIDAPTSYRGKTQGLCGTFNSNMQDDFLTPEGDIETTVYPFANKWQTKESCDFISDKVIPHPCQVNVENKAKAEKICSKLLKDKVFEECHLFVDPEPFYEDCLYDMCACKGEISQCACPILASYATECARQGTILNWRYQVAECSINCPIGQVFEQCGEACTRTCSDLQRELPCKLQCVEGCRCSDGQVLDENNECVTIAMCKCIYKGLEFKPGYKEVRPGRKHLELCTCAGGKWNCVEAQGFDAVKYPAATDVQNKCSPAKNEVFTTCEPAEPLTCKNMHMNVTSSTALCRPGCKCKDGYVLDTQQKLCVLPELCSCHHGGRSYNEGESIKEDCNRCLCKGGKWACTTKACAGTCSLYGDNHFSTFDGREFDFQGVCTYLLSKGKLLNSDGFSVEIQNVLCGSNGVTCSKTLTVNLIGDEPESITLSSDSPVAGIKSLSNAKPLKKMLTYRSGVFVVVEMPHIGVLLKWDRGTRVYLRLENRWKGKVQGLCGNYNYDALDDFLNPSAGIENNPIIFGHSWKLDDSCAMPSEQVDSCTLNPQRKTWAQRKCGLLKSSEFAPCHSEVSVDVYYKRCVHDTCSCDQGGDCECLCTALAAYAYACTAMGINIRWRTPDLCPMQCDPLCSNYNPCIESCPVETCDNLMHPLKNERLCSSDNCVEGCKLKGCPNGMVYQNDSHVECVSMSACKPICLQENGITYYEGDIMTSDSCHTCKCTRESKVCTGIPCVTSSLPPLEVADLFGCETGWTQWINQDVLNDLQNAMSSKSNYFKEDDIEPLPNELQFKNIGGKILCKPEMYAAIECRTVVGHNHPKMTGQNVECSLERGLVCKGQCFDYEIRVFCDCGDSTTTKKPAITAAPLKSTTVALPIIPIIPFTTPKYQIHKVCDPSVPNVDYPNDCNKYLQCVMASNGSYIYVEQTCGSSMMFNPKAMVCDWPASVIAIKPECGKPKPIEELQGDCPMGYVWSECAIPCRRACNYYGRLLTLSGNCTSSSNDCMPGCLPNDAAIKCEYPKLWRDWKSCVEISACTCMGPNNEQLKPGQVINIDNCKKCQCINSEFICTGSPCDEQKPIKIISSTIKPVSHHPEVEILITQQRTTQWPQMPSTTKKPSVIIVEQEVMELPAYITLCDPSIPHVEHPNSCYKFLHCMPAPNESWIYAVKTCYPDMMFNPAAMVCDWPASVKAMKPQCGVDPGETEIWEEEVKKKTIITKKTTPKPQFIVSPTQPPQIPSFSTVQPITYIPGQTTKKPLISKPEDYDEDYFEGKLPVYIRLCDPKIPLVEHPKSCYKYLQCKQAPNGSFVYEEATCYPDKMFNPKALNCDWPMNVIRIKPNCNENPGEIDFWEDLIKKVKRKPTPFTQRPPFVSTVTYGSSSTLKPSFLSTVTPIKMIQVPSYITLCDPTVPHVEHPNSCYKFLHCQPSPDGGWVYAVKTCYPDMMFNPAAMVCDWPASVQRLKPQCAVNPGEIEIWEEEVIKKTIIKTTPKPQFIVSPTQPSQIPSFSTIQPITYIPGQTTKKPLLPQPGDYDEDYFEGKPPVYIRLCDPRVPLVEHPKSCYKYLQCKQAPNGSFVYAEGTCYPDMMFNPNIMNCDWPLNVIKIKPNCGEKPGETDLWEEVVKKLTRKPTPTTQKTPFVSTVSYGPTVTPIKMIQLPSYITLCDPSIPHVEHPNSCYKFLHCMPAPNGSWIYAVKTCYPDMMFNPAAMVCDWPASVKAMKPQCGVNPGETEIWEEEIIETIIRKKTTPKSQITLPPTLPPLTDSPSGFHPVPIVRKVTTKKPIEVVTEVDEAQGQFGPITRPGQATTTTKPSGEIKGQVGAMTFRPWPTTSTTKKTIDEYDDLEQVPGFIHACDPKTPIIAHSESCHKYLECILEPSGVYTYVEKTCGSDLMFNPVKLDCDWFEEVYNINPNCKTSPGKIDTVDLKKVKPGLVTTRRPSKLKPKPKVTTLTPLIVLPSTVTPPMQCDDTKMVPLLHLLPATAFSSSSNLGNAFRPETARLDARPTDGSMGSWTPATNDLNQYIQVEFPQPLPIYGIIIRGSPLLSQYVTSFKVLYSLNDEVYHILDDKNGNPQIFSGSVDQNTPVQNIFRVPTEAKIVRIYPLKWHEAIALRIELLGCQRDPTKPITFAPVPVTTTTTPKSIEKVTAETKIAPTVFVPVTQPPIMYTIAPIQPLCDDPLGVENSKLSHNQVKFSSIKDTGSVRAKVLRYPLEVIKLSSARGWMPLADNVNEFVMFDFMENRNLTGVITKGGEYGWVKSFTILYSKDDVIWNKLLDQNGQPKQFLANVDSENVKKNYFPNPINARYLKIQPLKWNSAIEMKLEPIGCYKPYPTPDPSMTTTTQKYPDDVEIITPSNCGICKGATLPSSSNSRDTCLCYPPLYYNGNECVPQSDCPCFEGHISYPAGETYLTETCAECICQIGGTAQCKQKECKPCGKGFKRVAPNTCDCKCEKCPPETVLCQTSGECIPESSWCDGIQDCPDDELNCLITEQPTVTIDRKETITITKKCPDPNCPPGFVIKPKKSRKSKMDSRFSGDDDEEDDKPQHQYYYIKAKYVATYEAILPISTTKDKQDINAEECFEFMCIPMVDQVEPIDFAEGNQTKKIRCPEPKCPKGYMLRLQIQKTSDECAKFLCEPVVENDAVCNVTGRTFNTFDSTEFKYDICSHLLARDVSDEKWNVIMRKNCSTGNNVCTKEIEIKDKVAKYTLILYPSLTVNLDGYYFTVQQLQNSNRKMSFVVSKNGDNLLYVSHTHGIWVTLDQYGDIKLGISSQFVKQVDGLCGFYSNNKDDDKRMPNGKLAASTVEFGDSWSVSQGSAEDCVPHSCPKAVQEIAMKMCELVNDNIFTLCRKTINPNHFISTCLETACDCLLTATNGTSLASISSANLEKYKKECKCSMLKNYVVECMAADESVHLETWRSVHSCEATCAAPFVHQDCYRRSCETTCKNLQSTECASVPGTCFSGCFCPPGSVKKDQTCVPISECRDCVCDGFGKSQYLTYDRKNFTFDGNCTYLLTRDITLNDVHTFQVFATIGPCDTKANTIAKKKVTCTQALHIAYGSHIVHVQKNGMKNLEVIVDGIKLSTLSYAQNWMKITEQGKALNILLPESQVELTTTFETMSFSIKVPSVKYGNKMEGLCGDCNGNADDDMKPNPNAKLISTSTPLQNFALSWLAEDLEDLAFNEHPDKCHVDEETDCLPLAPETDPCFKILNEDVFGKCHFVVDPIMFVTACQQDLCRTGPTQKGSCDSIAAYARECARNGVCVDWRRNGFCTMECTAPYVYTPCGCPETCQSTQAKDNLIKSSPAIRDAKTIEKMKSICSIGISEGCFCPKGKVLHNGKCLREIECRACDDKGRLPGDIWHLDVCTKCTCQNDSTVQCQKIQCPAQQTICGIGYTAIESSPTGECCKKYACVPEQKPTDQRIICPQLVLPKCGQDQTNKIINGTDGCSKYICDCLPKSQCKPMQNYTNLEPGFKSIIDTTGCCPISKLICDKSLCPPKPIQCTEAFYVMEKTKSADDKICCDIYECRPPQNNCIATVNGKKILKKMDELWMTEDVCIKAVCAFDTNGNPIIKTQREICNIICQAGYELKPIPGKCCGECVKTKCIADNKLYEIGQTWTSDDKCTTYECNIKEGQTLITSMMPTCSDISSCPPLMRYKDGCCEKCKMESLSQKNCLPESLALSQTIGLIQVPLPPHGNCKNVNGIKGITECSGTCKSGTKFDPLTLHQLKNCECCSASGFGEIAVELVCDDNYKFIKNFNVPSSCSCSRCGTDDELKSLKLTAAS